VEAWAMMTEMTQLKKVYVLDMPTKYQEYVNNAACTDRQGSAAFLPRDATLARHMLSSHVRLSARLSEAGIVSKRLGKLSCFLARRLPFIYLTLL